MVNVPQYLNVHLRNNADPNFASWIKDLSVVKLIGSSPLVDHLRVFRIFSTQHFLATSGFPIQMLFAKQLYDQDLKVKD